MFQGQRAQGEDAQRGGCLRVLRVPPVPFETTVVGAENKVERRRPWSLRCWRIYGIFMMMMIMIMMMMMMMVISVGQIIFSGRFFKSKWPPQPATTPGAPVRQNLDGILAINEEAWQLYAKFLVHVRALRLVSLGICNYLSGKLT